MTYSIITSSDRIMTIIYYIGLIACIAAGQKKSQAYHLMPLIFQIINSFGGGITRDLLCLHTKVWFFTAEAIPDIFFVFIVGSIYSLVIERVQSNTKAKEMNDTVIDVMDALSLGSFIAIGADKSFDLGFNLPTAIICGYVTGCLGGITANFMNPMVILTPLNLYYQIIALLGSTLYCHIRNGYLVCIFILFCLLTLKVEYGIIFTYSRLKLLYTLTKIDVSARISSFRVFFARVAIRAKEGSAMKKVARYPCAYLAFHRLRICNS